MPKTLHLHIGWPKCASSTLQHMLAANRRKLAKLGFHYPIVKGKKNLGNAKPLIVNAALADSPPDQSKRKFSRFFLRHPDLKNVSDKRKFYQKHYLRTGLDNVILSGEGLYRAARVNDMSYVFEPFESIRVYWVIRPKMLKVQSGYLHGVRSGRYKHELADLIDFDFYHAKAEDNHSYMQVIRYWSELAGIDNLNILLISDRWPSVEKQFFEAMLGHYPDDLTPSPVRNVKIGAVPTAAIMALPEQPDNLSEYREKIRMIRKRAKRLGVTDRTVNVLTPDVHARLSERFRADDEAFARSQDKITLDDICPDISGLVSASTTLAAVREWEDYIRLKNSLAGDGIHV